MTDDRFIVRAAPVSPPADPPVRGVDEAMIRRLVERFYEAARTDDLLGPVFDAAIPDDAWPHHFDTLTAFWSSVMLKTGTYGGRPMPKHVALPGLDDQHFVRWLGLFRRAAEEVLPPEAAALFVARAERVGHSFRLGVKFHRGEHIALVEPIQAPVI